MMNILKFSLLAQKKLSTEVDGESGVKKERKEIRYKNKNKKAIPLLAGLTSGNPNLLVRNPNLLVRNPNLLVSRPNLLVRNPNLLVRNRRYKGVECARGS